MKGARVHRRPVDSPHLGLTSLMDVLTILLIFLLVNYSDQFNDVPNFVSLPLAASSLGELNEKPGGTAVVGPDRIVLNERTFLTSPWNPSALLESLSGELAAFPPDNTLYIVADKDVPYRVVDLLVAAASERGIFKVNFLAKAGK